MTIVRRGASQLRVVIPLLMLVAVVAGCSSSGGKDTVGPNAKGQTTATVSTPAATSPSSTAAVSTPAAPSPSSTAAPDPAAQKNITTAYKTFFSGKAAPSQSQAALQH